jgi:hypothetical protein
MFNLTMDLPTLISLTNPFVLTATIIGMFSDTYVMQKNYSEIINKESDEWVMDFYEIYHTRCSSKIKDESEAHEDCWTKFMTCQGTRPVRLCLDSEMSKV